MRTIIQYFNNIFIKLLPETRCFGIKSFLWKLAGVKIGENVRICSSVTIIGSGKLIIGSNTWVGPKVFISSSEKVEIGEYCDIAPRVYIGDGTHAIETDSQRIAGMGKSYPIKIGSGCWLAANCTILAGVSIANKCIVAAGSVVTESFTESEQLIAGVPAKIKKTI